MIQAEAPRNFTHEGEFRGGGGGKARGLLGEGWVSARSERALPSLKPTHQRPEAFGNRVLEAHLTIGDVLFYGNSLTEATDRTGRGPQESARRVRGGRTASKRV